MTGLAVGAVDTYRLVKAGGRTVDQSRVARLAFHEMGRSGLVVSVFFALYQVCKCGIAAAGIEGAGALASGAVAAMKEVGVDISRYSSDAMTESVAGVFF